MCITLSCSMVWICWQCFFLLWKLCYVIITCFLDLLNASQHHDQSGLSGTLPGTEDQIFVQLFVVRFEQIVVCDLHSLLGADDVCGEWWYTGAFHAIWCTGLYRELSPASLPILKQQTSMVKLLQVFGFDASGSREARSLSTWAWWHCSFYIVEVCCCKHIAVCMMI